jgi:hypothetical protein
MTTNDRLAKTGIKTAVAGFKVSFFGTDSQEHEKSHAIYLVAEDSVSRTVFTLPMKINTKQSQYYRKEITPVLPIAGQKFLQYFAGHLEFFAVFQKFYLFIPRFLTETLTMLSGTLAGTQWFRILPLYHFARRTAMTKQVAGH